MKYYILNINYAGKSEVDHWLDEKKFAPIFYGQTTLEQIHTCNNDINRVARIDAELFVNTFKNGNDDDIIFSIGNDSIYFFKQAGNLIEKGQYEKDLAKGFDIVLLKKIKINSCPLVLSSIKANRYFSSGTFRKISPDSNIGNIKALDYIISGEIVSVNTLESYFRCLSSLEFETLIAKFLEEKGFFVPAYKGGFLRNFDLFCTNDSADKIPLGKFEIFPNQQLSVQIKLSFKKNHDLKNADLYYFCITSEINQDNIFDSAFLFNELKSCPNTFKWLKRTLNWVTLNETQTNLQQNHQ